jgi:hypothetical protein
MLWAERGRTGRLAAVMNAVGLVVTGDMFWVTLLGLIHSLHLYTGGVSGQALLAALIFSAPLTLLAMSVFYLWVYARNAHAANDREGACEAGGG